MTARLIYVMGASGSGKDSLMRYARERLAGDKSIQFIHRYITRPAEAGGENHVALTAEEFEARRQANLFALCWRSHGLDYGIGVEIHQWLSNGVTVVVNGSREYLPEARTRYPKLLPIWVEVNPEILRERLLSRGRETIDEIETRLMRHHKLHDCKRDGETVHNDGMLATAGEQLISVIQRHKVLLLCE